MLTIAKLFTKSPFSPLQNHMDKVVLCLRKLPPLLQAALQGDEVLIASKSQEISELEHEADLTRNGIRNHLPKSLFLPIDRGTLLDILTLQDDIADKAEDIGILLTYRKLEQFNGEAFSYFCQKNIDTCLLAAHVIQQLDQLLEFSFGGIEAEKVKEMVETIAYQEHEIDILQRELVKQLYNACNSLTYIGFHHFNALIKEIGTLSNLAEKLGDRIRMILEIH